MTLLCAEQGNNHSLLPSARVQSGWSFTSNYSIYFHGVVLEARDNSLKNHWHIFTYFVYIISLINILADIWEEEEEEERLGLEVEEDMDMKNKEYGE